MAKLGAVATRPSLMPIGNRELEGITACTSVFGIITKDNGSACMNFWWVNHGTSYKRELGDGYIWCPQVGPEDRHRESWVNVSRVRAGDVIFSYAKQHLHAVGIAQSNAFDAPPREGYAANGWSKDGWEVSVTWQRLLEPFSLHGYVEDVQQFLPDVHSPLRRNGHATLTYLSAISDAFSNWLLHHSGANVSLIEDLAADIEINNQQIPITQKLYLHQARVGQGLYRREVLRLENKCRLTAVSDPAFLIASHIKPWRASTNLERLDRHNGLMLAPHVDRLFDKGWISFEDDGTLLVADAAVKTLKAWALPVEANVGPFSDKKAPYLKFHREHVFGRTEGV